ncbi:hypothetical protein U0070_022817 [Myodes glareolus]|uniref:Uncharacterized protein n=1 Tax=Myodes glareolus TaxID=447135 RepID=A0AAW0KAF8_MYOGA
MDLESPLGISGHIAKSLRKPPGSVLAPALGGAVDPAAQLQAVGRVEERTGAEGTRQEGRQDSESTKRPTSIGAGLLLTAGLHGAVVMELEEDLNGRADKNSKMGKKR